MKREKRTQRVGTLRKLVSWNFLKRAWLKKFNDISILRGSTW